MFNLSPIYSARKSPNYKLSKNHKISPDTNLQKTYTNIKHKSFEELVSSELPLLIFFFLKRGHTERTNSSKVLCLMFVYVFCKFVSGLIVWFLDNLWFDDLRAE